MRIVAGSLMGFPESSGRTSHTISHSHSISTMSFYRLAWKKEVIKVNEALIDQCVGRSVGGSKGLNGLWTGSLHGVSSKVLMPLLRYEGVSRNEWRLRLLFAGEDSRANPFAWQSMVALLSLWEHTGGKTANE